MKEYLQFIVFVLTGLRCQGGGVNCTRNAKKGAVSGFDFRELYQKDFQKVLKVSNQSLILQ